MLQHRPLSPGLATVLLSAWLASCTPTPSTSVNPSNPNNPSVTPSASPSASQPQALPSASNTPTELNYTLPLPEGLDSSVPLKVDILPGSTAPAATFEISLAAGSRQLNLPKDRFAGQKARLRLTAQPLGTCFRVQSEVDFVPLASGNQPAANIAALAQRGSWTAIDSQGSSQMAAACVQGTVSDQQGKALANALVLLGGTNPGNPPTLLRTDAKGNYLLSAASFGSAGSTRQLELHAGMDGYRPQKRSLQQLENKDWSPTVNRFDFRLQTADQDLTATTFTLVSPSAQNQLDFDYTQNLSLSALSASDLSEKSPSLLELVLNPAQIAQGKDFSVNTLKQSQPYRLSLKENSCAQATFQYYGLVDQENRLDTSNWSSLKLKTDCVESFPLQLKVTDTVGRNLAGVQLQYSFEEYNPTNLPADQAPRSNRSGTTDSEGKLLTTVIPLYKDNASVVTLSLIKAGYTTLNTTFTVRKPKGDPTVNQLTLKMTNTR